MVALVNSKVKAPYGTLTFSHPAAQFLIKRINFEKQVDEFSYKKLSRKTAGPARKGQNATIDDKCCILHT